MYVISFSNNFSHGPKSQAITDEIRNLSEMMISKDDLQQVHLQNIFRTCCQILFGKKKSNSHCFNFQFDNFVKTEGDLLTDYKLNIQDALDRINKNIAWVDKHLDELKTIIIPP